MGIILKSKREIEILKRANQLVGELLIELAKKVEPGITTLKLDEFAEKFLLKRGAKPAFKGYMGYPNTLCTSINEEVIHGIPSTRKLKEGDIISIDVGALVDGYYGDAAITLPVGEIDAEAKRLLKVTRESLCRGIEKAIPGNRLGDVSSAIQQTVESNGFSVVRAFVGHGIGRSLHEEPQIPNYGEPGYGPILKSGMVLAIEPMVNMGTYEVLLKEDRWTAVTRDGKLSAHFEHSIAITENGTEILSKLVDEIEI